jgi:hypothetical protein
MMEGFHYFSETELGLEDVAKCIEATGYTTHINFSHVPELFVSFVSHYGDTYFRWSKILTDVSQLELEEQSEIKSVNLNPKTLLSGEYMKLTLPNVIPILKRVLNCYGGYIRLEFGFYNSENIDNALNDASTYGFFDV